jgi:putative ATP-dependent endonuclease of OLD family
MPAYVFERLIDGEQILMHLSQIHVLNFRIFGDFKLSLNPSLNLIVGENNSGKTALIDAVRYVLDTNSSEWIRIQESDFRRGQTTFTIQLKFDEITPKQARVFVEHLTHEQLPSGQGRKSVLYANFHAELTDQLSRGNRLIRVELRSGQTGEGPSIEREIRNYLSATYLKPLRDAEGELTASRGSRLSQVLQSSKKLREQSNVEQLLTTLIEANKQILANDGIAWSLDQISRQLKGLTFSNDQLSPAIEIMGGMDSSKLSEPEKKSMFRGILEKLQLLIDEQDRHQGLGYNNLLFMATELLLLEQEQDDFPLLLIEEPEAHLHPQLQMKFLRAIREDFGNRGKPPLQSILTTHSPNLASKAPLESIVIMAEGKAFPLRSGGTELDISDYSFLEKFLDVTKSNLFFAKCVIMVEGDSENILLPTIAELLGTPLENFGVSVVNVGNTAFARYAKIFQRKGLGAEANKSEWLPTKVVCLRDLDLWPDRAEKQNSSDEIGFKDKKQPNAQGHGGNFANWLGHYDVPGLEAYQKAKKEIGGQNVSVELSDAWTFEYSLALKGLAAEVYEAVNNGVDGFADLPADPEERAIKIYGLVESSTGGKTKTAYNLSRILRRQYRVNEVPAGENESKEETLARQAENEKRKAAQRDALLGKLPEYVVQAINYVTGSCLPPLAPEDSAHTEQAANA